MSIVNPWLRLPWLIDNIPLRFWKASRILIPAIILGDAGALVAMRWGR